MSEKKAENREQSGFQPSPDDQSMKFIVCFQVLDGSEVTEMVTNGLNI